MKISQSVHVKALIVVVNHKINVDAMMIVTVKVNVLVRIILHVIV